MMKRTVIPLSLSLLTLFLPAISSARNAAVALAGAGYYVSPNGNDTNPGTQAEPWLTVGHAAATAVAGDTVNVEPGTYTLLAQLTLSTSGAAGSPITFVSTQRHGAAVVLDRSATSDRAVEIDGDYVTWDGFDVSAPDAGNARLGVITYGIGDVVRHNYIHDVATGGCTAFDTAHGGAGIDLTSPTGDAPATGDVADANLIQRIGPATAGLACDKAIHGIYVSTPSNTVANNIVSTVSGYGIHAFHNPNNEVIANNSIDHAGYSGVLVGCAALAIGQSADTAQNNVVVNNIARDSGSNGFREYEEGTPACTVSNNVFANNDSYNNAAGEYFLYSGDGSTYSDGIDVDPLYVDYAAGDDHLGTGSPAIGAGTATDAPNHDYDGRSRPTGSAVDLGAYAYVPPVPVAVVPCTVTVGGQQEAGTCTGTFVPGP